MERNRIRQSVKCTRQCHRCALKEISNFPPPKWMAIRFDATESFPHHQRRNFSEMNEHGSRMATWVNVVVECGEIVRQLLVGARVVREMPLAFEWRSINKLLALFYIWAVPGTKATWRQVNPKIFTENLSIYYNFLFFIKKENEKIIILKVKIKKFIKF